MDGRPDGVRDPVLSVIFERAAAGSRPRQRAAGVRTVRDADDDSALRCTHGTSLLR